jgi:hypothetical protein
MLDHEFRSRHGAGAAKKRQSQMYDGQLKPARGAIETGAAGCWLPDSRREAGTIGAARPMVLRKCSGMARLQCRQPPSHDHQGSDRIGHARRDTHDEAGKRLVLQASEAADSAAPGRDKTCRGAEMTIRISCSTMWAAKMRVPSACRGEQSANARLAKPSQNHTCSFAGRPCRAGSAGRCQRCTERRLPRAVRSPAARSSSRTPRRRPQTCAPTLLSSAAPRVEQAGSALPDVNVCEQHARAEAGGAFEDGRRPAPNGTGRPTRYPGVKHRPDQEHAGQHRGRSGAKWRGLAPDRVRRARLGKARASPENPRNFMAASA